MWGKNFEERTGDDMRIDVIETKITPLDRKVCVRVFLPDGYETGKKCYPVLYVNDGQDVFCDEQAFWGAESLRFEQYYRDYGHFLPEVILVAVEAPEDHGERTAQYSPFTKDFVVPEGKTFEPHIEGKGVEYLDWMTGELKEQIDRTYRTFMDADHTGICGYSTGGLISTYAILKYGHIFHRAIIMSAAVCIWMDKLEEVLKTADCSHIKRLYLDTGTNEFGRMTTKEEFLEGAETICRYFTGHGLTKEIMKYNVYQDAIHAQREWRLRFPDALRWVFFDGK